MSEKDDAGELGQRFRVTALKVNIMIATTIAVTIIGTAGHEVLHRPGHEDSLGILSMVVVVLAIGAILLRRTRFQITRLQDVATLRGVTGLLRVLQGTTLQVGYMALTIALVGFAGTVVSGNYEVVRTGVIALVLFIYCYPRKRSWERVVKGIQMAGDSDDTTARGVNK